METDKSYAVGFFTKCAESGLEYEDADAMFKQAWNFQNTWDDVRSVHRGLANDMREKGIDEAYLRGMGTRGLRLLRVLRNPKDLPSNWFNRHFNPFSYNERDQLNLLREDYQNLLGERERIRQRQEQERQEREAAAAAQRQQTPAAQAPQIPAAPTRPADYERMYDKIMTRKLAPPIYAGHQFDGKTGKLYRTDGKPLDPGADYWNAQIDYDERAYANHQKDLANYETAMKDWNAKYKPAGQTGATPVIPKGNAPAPVIPNRPKYSLSQERDNQSLIDLMNGTGAYGY